MNPARDGGHRYYRTRNVFQLGPRRFTDGSDPDRALALVEPGNCRRSDARKGRDCAAGPSVRMLRNCCSRAYEDGERPWATPRRTREAALRDDRDCSCRPLRVVTRQRPSRRSDDTRRHRNHNRVVALVLLLRSDHESTRALRVMRRDRYPRLSEGRIMDRRRRRVSSARAATGTQSAATARMSPTLIAPEPRPVVGLRSTGRHGGPSPVRPQASALATTSR